MHRIIFQNKITKEIWICDDIRFKRIFEGAEFVSVHRVDQTHQVLMRLDALQQI